VVLKLSEPASILRLEGRSLSDQGQAGGGAGRRYHGGRRQFRGCLPRCASRRCGSALKPHVPAIGSPAFVVCHPGAIIPRAAMPSGLVPNPRPILASIAMTAASRQERVAAIFKSATVIPVLTIERLEDAVPLARALVAGGVRVLEVTLRTPVAVEAAKAMISEVPEAIVGIGHDPERRRSRACQGARGQIRHQPGATAGAVESRRRWRPAVRPGDRDGFRADAGAGGGLRSRQILPAEPAGGIKALRALVGPFRISACARPTGALAKPTRRPGWLSRMSSRWGGSCSARRWIYGPATGPA